MINKAWRSIAIWMVVALHAYVDPAAASTTCDKEILSNAEKLLVLHKGKNPAIKIERSIKQAPSVKSFLGKKTYKVFEVWGHIDKARYRMRFIYAILPDGYCVLMGEEILDF